MATDKEYKAVIDALSGECERLHKENEELKKALKNHDTFMKYSYEQGKQDALSQEPCTDAVSRKDVINAIDKWITEYKPQHYLIQSIRELPSVNPKPCDDAISRDAFITRYREWMKSEYGKIPDDDTLAIRVIKSLPPVTQKPKYWIDKDNKIYKMPDDIPIMTIQYPTIQHGDTISRMEVMKVISDFVTFEKYIDKHNHITFEPLEQMINSLPSVTQKGDVKNV